MRWLNEAGVVLAGVALSGLTVSCGDDDGPSSGEMDAAVTMSSEQPSSEGSTMSPTNDSKSTGDETSSSSGSGSETMPATMDTGMDAGASGDPTGDTTSETSSMPGDASAPAMDSQLPPTTAEAMQMWLAAGYYLDWVCEDEPNEKTDGAAAIHVHGAKTRVCSNVLLAASRAPGTEGQFPAGVAAVKEVYDGQGELLTTVVSVKTAEDSEGGDNWYWYENETTEGFGFAGCTGCHGVAGADEEHPGAGDFVYFQVKDEAQLPPVGDADEVLAWLDEAHYLDWKCEDEPTVKLAGAAGIHAHGTNRICVNQKLAEGELEDGSWPAGIAAVKELYGDGDAGEVLGRVLYTKIAANSDQGTGFYWFAGEEVNGFGVTACTGCHGAAGSDAEHPGAGDYVYERLAE